MTSERRLFWVFSILTGGLYAFRLLFHWISPLESFASQTPDDAYYYFQVARNLAAGAGSTFDGINTTNGYHPLWLFVCSLIALPFSPAGTDLTMLALQARTTLTIQWMAGFAGICLLMAATDRWRIGYRGKAALIACAGLPPVIYGVTDGLESGLVLLGLGALALIVARHDPFSSPDWRRDLELGLVLSLLFLVRLDLALLSLAVGIVATGLLITGKLPFRHWLIKGIYWGFPVFATASIYFLFNLALTSSVTPISGALKSSFPEISFQSSKLRILIYPVFLLFFAVICLLVSRRHQSQYFLLFGVTFMALHLVYTALFMEWGVHLWHFTGYLPFVLLGAACLTEKATDGPIHRFGVFAACGIIVLWAFIGQFHFLWQRADRAFQAQSVKAALWTRENVPAGRVIGMSDCGVFGYFRGGLVVNLDGLINNRNYQEHVAKEGLASYLYSQNIHLIAHHAVPIERLGAEVPYWRYSRPSRLFEQLADPFIDLRRTAIIYGGPEFHDGRGPRRFVIWRISHTMNQREAPLR